MTKTRKVAWIWANIYGYGDDDLFSSALYDPEAAYLAVVQAGVILVLFAVLFREPEKPGAAV